MSTILEELPFVFVISTSKKSQVCHNCCIARGGQTLRRCSGCRFAHYCSETCQRRAWTDHRHECGNLKKVHPRLPTDTARLMARIIFKQMEGGYDQLDGDGKRTYGMLMSHVTEIQNDPIRMEHFGSLCSVLNEYLGEDKLPNASELLDMFGKICVNSFSIVEADGNEIGVGLYLQLSALDHSCDPDAVVVFDGPKAILNSIDAAKDCSDFYNVKISYIDLLSTSSERQQQLKEQYYFVCSCARCNDDHQDKLMESFACSNQSCEGVVLASSADDDNGVCETCDATVVMEPASRLMQQIKWQLEELDALQKSEDFSTLYERCTDLIKKASGVLHPLNIYYVRLLEHAFDSAIQLENWPQAIEFGHACSRGRSLYYHAGHPSLTYHFAKVGKILQYTGQLEEAEKYLQQALDEAKLSHGDKHRLYVTISELFSSCREERRLQLTTTQKLDK